MNPFGVAVWGECAKGNELYGVTDAQIRLDQLSEEHECSLIEKHYNEERNSIENKPQTSTSVDISALG